MILFFWPSRIIKEVNNDFLLHGGKKLVTRDHEKLIMQVTAFVFNHFVAGNLPVGIVSVWAALMSRFGCRDDSIVEQMFSLIAATCRSWGITGEVIKKLEKLASDPDNEFDETLIRNFEIIMKKYSKKVI